jgi:hypothetical protein
MAKNTKPAPKAAPQTQRRPPPPPPRQTAARQPAPPPPQRQAAPPPERNAPQSGTAVATRAAASNVPAHLRERIAQSTGKGVSKDASDNLVPLIYVLQELSPQAQSRDPRYIEGAVAGNFWLRGMDPPLVDGENEGMLVQPCYFNKVVIEWQPNRGGFVARHDTMPEDAQQVEDPQDPNIKRWVNGRQLSRRDARARRARASSRRASRAVRPAVLEHGSHRLARLDVRHEPEAGRRQHR